MSDLYKNAEKESEKKSEESKSRPRIEFDAGDHPSASQDDAYDLVGAYAGQNSPHIGNGSGGSM